MTPSPVIPPDDPGDHGKLDDVIDVDTDDLEDCCAAGNVILQNILDELNEIETDAESCCSDTQDILTNILNALGGGSVERLVDGDIQVGVGTITVPDGVISFSVSVLAGGSDPTSLTDWVTIDGPDFVAAVPLRNGQSVSHAADGSNTLNGPITITIPASAAANATWVTP